MLKMELAMRLNGLYAFYGLADLESDIVNIFSVCWPNSL